MFTDNPADEFLITLLAYAMSTLLYVVLFAALLILATTQIYKVKKKTLPENFTRAVLVTMSGLWVGGYLVYYWYLQR